MSDDQDGCEWVNVSSGTAYLGSPGQKVVIQLSLYVGKSAPWEVEQ